MPGVRIDSPQFNTGFKRGEFVLHTVNVSQGKSDMEGSLARQLYTDGKWSFEQLQAYYRQRLQKLDPFNMESSINE